MHKYVPSRGEPRISRVLIGRIIIGVLYLVGVIGLSLPDYQDIFLGLTPAHLLVSLFLILFYHRGYMQQQPFGWDLVPS
jgi:hypothetical protein